jgi:hypothetical protein
MRKDKKAKTVGLATCFLNNYGACLQAYALQQMIEELKYKCYIINYNPPEGYIQPSRGVRKFAKQCLNMLPVGCIPKRYRDYFASGRYGFDRQFEKFRTRHLKFDSKRIRDEKGIIQNPPEMDLYVCGSDQIWNPVFYGGNNPVYLLQFVPEGKRRIAYAPSIGLSEFPEEYRLDFRFNLQKFDVLSVREESGRRIVEDVCGVSCKCVLDPTLLYGADRWSSLSEASSIRMDEPYMFCYIFGDREYEYELAEALSQAANLPVVAIPFNDRWDRFPGVKLIRSAGPQDFLKLIQHAQLVITDSFHATAFSINYHKNFWTLYRDSAENKAGMNSRIINILELLGLQGRLLDEHAEASRSVNVDEQICWGDVDEKITILRKDSIDYLKNALKADTGAENESF